jgi:hypothetical protein
MYNFILNILIFKIISPTRLNTLLFTLFSCFCRCAFHSASRCSSHSLRRCFSRCLLRCFFRCFLSNSMSHFVLTKSSHWLPGYPLEFYKYPTITILYYQFSFSFHCRFFVCLRLPHLCISESWLGSRYVVLNARLISLFYRQHAISFPIIGLLWPRHPHISSHLKR